MLLIEVLRICDHWYKGSPVPPTASLYSSRILTKMRIRIQFLTLMRIRIQLLKIMRIHVDLDPQTGLQLCAYLQVESNTIV
jgi:hypothetical protein